MPTEKQWNKIKWNNAYRKSKDIAYFNSLNAAIQVVNPYFERVVEEGDIDEAKKIRGYIIHWRDFFFKEWHKWWLKENPKPDDRAKSDIEAKIAQEFRTEEMNEQERLEGENYQLLEK